MTAFWAQHKNTLRSLTPTEQKISDWLQQHEQDVLSMSIATVANAADVSQPSIIRFCRKLGLSGFPELKIQLAQHDHHDLESEEFGFIGYGQQQLSAQDTTETLARKVLHNGIADINWLDSPDTFASIEEALSLLSAAVRIECFGVGGSAIAAQDAVLKLNRLGFIANFSLSLHDYEQAFHRWNAGTVLWLFSRNSQGFVPQIIEAAQDSGIDVILIGPKNGKTHGLSAQIITKPEASMTIEAPIKSRVTQLMIVDIILNLLKIRSQSDVKKGEL